MSLTLPTGLRCALERYAQHETGSPENARRPAWLRGLTHEEAQAAVGALLPDLRVWLSQNGLSLLGSAADLQQAPSQAQGRVRVSICDHAPHLLAPAIQAYWACEVTPAGALRYRDSVESIAMGPNIAAYLEKYWITNTALDYPRERVRAQALSRLSAIYGSATLADFSCTLCGQPLANHKVRRRSEASIALGTPCPACQARLGQAAPPSTAPDTEIPLFLRRPVAETPGLNCF